MPHSRWNARDNKKPSLAVSQRRFLQLFPRFGAPARTTNQLDVTPITA
jgi:hypothetical protein